MSKITDAPRAPFAAAAKHCLHTIFHPFDGFADVHWKNYGNEYLCGAILLIFFLVNVFDQVLTGLIFNTYNPDRISVPSIFLISVGGFAIVYLANWAVSSLMFTEGTNRGILVVLSYSLVPWCITELLWIFISNFANLELEPFMTALRIIGLLWAGVLLLIGMLAVHQLSFGGTLLNLLLTVIGILVVLFLLLLGYMLLQQIITFVRTIWNEIAFRL